MKTGILAILLLLSSCSADLGPTITVGKLVQISAEDESVCRGTILKIDQGYASSETFVYHSSDSQEVAFSKFTPYLGKNVRIKAMQRSNMGSANCKAGVTEISEQ